MLKRYFPSVGKANYYYLITFVPADKKLQTTLDEVRQEELVKRENALKMQTKRVKQQEAVIQVLRQVQNEFQSNFP